MAEDDEIPAELKYLWSLGYFHTHPFFNPITRRIDTGTIRSHTCTFKRVGSSFWCDQCDGLAKHKSFINLFNRRLQRPVEMETTRIGNNGFRHSFATPMERVIHTERRLLQQQTFIHELQRQLAQRKVATDVLGMASSEITHDDFTKKITKLFEENRFPLHQSLLRNMVEQLSSNPKGHRYLSVVRDVALSFRTLLGHGNYELFASIFRLPAESTLRRAFNDSPSLEMGLSDRALDLSADRFRDQLVVLSVDAGRCKRRVEFVRGHLVGMASSLAGFLVHDPDRSQFDVGEMQVPVPKPTGNQDEFEAVHSFVKQLYETRGKHTCLAHHYGLIVCSSLFTHQPSIFQAFFPEPTRALDATKHGNLLDMVVVANLKKGTRVSGFCNDNAGHYLRAALTWATAKQCCLFWLGLSEHESLYAPIRSRLGAVIPYSDMPHFVRVAVRNLKYQTLQLTFFQSEDGTRVTASIGDITQLYLKLGRTSGFTKEQLTLRWMDQNTPGALRMLSQDTINALEEHVPGSEGTRLLLKALLLIHSPYSQGSASGDPVQQVRNVFTGLAILVYWKLSLISFGLRLHSGSNAASDEKMQGHFLTSQCFNAARLLAYAVPHHHLNFYLLFRHLGWQKSSLARATSQPVETGIGQLEGKSRQKCSPYDVPSCGEILQRGDKLQAQSDALHRVAAASNGTVFDIPRHRRDREKHAHPQLSVTNSLAASVAFEYDTTYEGFRKRLYEAKTAAVMEDAQRMIRETLPCLGDYLEEKKIFDKNPLEVTHTFDLNFFSKASYTELPEDYDETAFAVCLAPKHIVTAEEKRRHEEDFPAEEKDHLSEDNDSQSEDDVPEDDDEDEEMEMRSIRFPARNPNGSDFNFTMRDATRSAADVTLWYLQNLWSREHNFETLRAECLRLRDKFGWIPCLLRGDADPAPPFSEEDVDMSALEVLENIALPPDLAGQTRSPISLSSKNSFFNGCAVERFSDERLGTTVRLLLLIDVVTESAVMTNTEQDCASFLCRDQGELLSLPPQHLPLLSRLLRRRIWLLASSKNEELGEKFIGPPLVFLHIEPEHGEENLCLLTTIAPEHTPAVSNGITPKKKSWPTWLARNTPKGEEKVHISQCLKFASSGNEYISKDRGRRHRVSNVIGDGQPSPLHDLCLSRAYIVKTPEGARVGFLADIAKKDQHIKFATSTDADLILTFNLLTFREADETFSLEVGSRTGRKKVGDLGPAVTAVQERAGIYTLTRGDLAIWKREANILERNVSESSTPSTTGRMYLVEHLLDRRGCDGSFEYLVSWKHYPRAEATWETRQSLEYYDLDFMCNDMDQLMATRNRRSGSDRPKREAAQQASRRKYVAQLDSSAPRSRTPEQKASASPAVPASAAPLAKMQITSAFAPQSEVVDNPGSKHSGSATKRKSVLSTLVKAPPTSTKAKTVQTSLSDFISLGKEVKTPVVVRETSGKREPAQPSSGRRESQAAQALLSLVSRTKESVTAAKVNTSPLASHANNNKKQKLATGEASSQKKMAIGKATSHSAPATIAPEKALRALTSLGNPRDFPTQTLPYLASARSDHSASHATKNQPPATEKATSQQPSATVAPQSRPRRPPVVFRDLRDQSEIDEEHEEKGLRALQSIGLGRFGPAEVTPRDPLSPTLPNLAPPQPDHAAGCSSLQSFVANRHPQSAPLLVDGRRRVR